MENHSQYLPEFHLQTLSRTPRSARQKLLDEHRRIRQHSLSELGDCLSNFIPKHLFEQDAKGTFSRRRLFSKENTFWAFFSQVLDADGGCREAIRKVQAFIASKGQEPPSSSTSAYCQAR